MELVEKTKELVTIFNAAIVDMTIRFEREKESLEAADRASLEYVIGMATVNAYNLEKLVERGVAYYEQNRDKVSHVIRVSGTFAASLQAEGFGC